MNLISLPFLGFASIVFWLYYFFPRRQREILLVANALFVASWGLDALIAVFLISNLVFFSLRKADFRPGRRLALVLALVPLAILLGYKLLQARSPVSLDGRTGVILPLGLSYYVFQLSGYVIDCYRRDVAEPFTWLRFNCFVSFFPQLMMGPIEKFATMKEQYRDPVEFDLDRFISGVFRVTLGVLKKVALADPLFPVFRLAFHQLDSLGGAQIVLFCVIGFFQVYFDFSAYSDIAVGLGRVLGIRLTENFRQPYLATSVSDIWNRWHVSLVRWVRGYVFLPLFLKTRSVLFCSLVTFVCVGLWHRMTVNFLFWSVYWFLFFVVEQRLKALSPLKAVPLWGARLGAMLVMALASIFFLESSAGGIVHAFFRVLDGRSFLALRSTMMPALSGTEVAGIAICFLLAIGQEFLEFDPRFEGIRVPRVLLPCAVANTFLAALLASDVPRPFVYLMF